MVLHGQHAQLHLGRAGLARRHVGLLADEVGGLHPGAGQAGLQRVVLALQFGAHEAVTLLEASRGAVHAAAGGAQPQVGAGGHESVPEVGPVVPGGVDLPAGVAHVGDAEQFGADRPVAAAQLHGRHRAVRRVAPAVIAQGAQHLRGVRSPQSERRDVVGDVPERDRTVGGHVALRPELVAPAVEDAGDDAHLIVARAHHREIGVEAAVGGEPGRVDGAPHRHVDPVHGQAVGVFHGAGTGQLEDLEGAEVHQPAVLPQVEVLAHGDGAPPAVVPLHLAVGQPVTLGEVGVGGEPLRALPGAGLEELGAEGLLAREVGADAQVAAALPLLGRVDDAVRLVEVLRGAGPDVGVAALLGIEAGHIRAVGVDDPRVAEGHPLGDDLGHAGAFLHPDGRRRPEVAHVGDLAEAGHGVGRQREQAVDGVADLGVAEHVHQLDGLLHLLVEVIGRERHLRW